MATRIPLHFVVATGELFDPVTLLPLSINDFPQPQQGDEYIFCCSAYYPDRVTPYPFGTGDTFECGGDRDFIHYITDGVLSAGLTASDAVTAIVASLDDETKVPLAGYIKLINAANQTERIAFSSYDSATNTFTVNHTMIYSYLTGAVIQVEDNLMFYSGNDQVDIPGDWDEINRAAGKFSVRVNMDSDAFASKLSQYGDNDGLMRIHLEIRHYVSGSVKPSRIINTNQCYAKNTVINHNDNSGLQSIQYINETQLAAALAAYAALAGTSVTLTAGATTVITIGTGTRYLLDISIKDAAGHYWNRQCYLTSDGTTGYLAPLIGDASPVALTNFDPDAGIDGSLDDGSLKISVTLTAGDNLTFTYNVLTKN